MWDFGNIQDLDYGKGVGRPEGLTLSVCALGGLCRSQDQAGSLKQGLRWPLAVSTIKGPGLNGIMVVFVKHSLGATCRVTCGRWLLYRQRYGEGNHDNQDGVARSTVVQGVRYLGVSSWPQGSSLGIEGED